MSVIIKNMDMPKYCNDCQFVEDSFGCCSLTGEHIENYEFWSDENEKPEWCPLKESEE